MASQRFGHSSVLLALDTYSHAVEGPDADAGERVQLAVLVAGDSPAHRRRAA